MKKILVIASLFICFVSFAQEVKQIDSIKAQKLVVEEDTLADVFIDMDEVMIFDRLKFSTKEEHKRYLILKRKTLKVYPYAKMAAERLTTLNERLKKIKSKSRRRKYTKRIQKFIEKEFSAKLKKLTITEGQILIKLIHRQTGITAFNLIKQLRNGWKAFWYNTTANMFNISLKKEFHPESDHEDYLIEEILQRAFAQKALEKQESPLAYNYLELTNKWSKKNKRKK